MWFVLFVLKDIIYNDSVFFMGQAGKVVIILVHHLYGITPCHIYNMKTL